MEVKELSAKEIAEITGRSISRIYALAKEYGRFPTVEEVLNRTKIGRPRKNFK